MPPLARDNSSAALRYAVGAADTPAPFRDLQDRVVMHLATSRVTPFPADLFRGGVGMSVLKSAIS